MVNITSALIPAAFGSLVFRCPVDQTLMELANGAHTDLFGPFLAPANNTSAFECPLYGHGVTPLLDESLPATNKERPILESTDSIQGIQNKLQENQNATGFSVSVWFTPTALDDAKQARILTIGKRNVDGNNLSGGCPGYDFQIRQNGEQLVVSWTDFSSSRRGSTFDRCRTQYSTNWKDGVTVEAGELMNLVVTFRNTRARFAINGVQQTDLIYPFNIKLENWKSDYGIQLFSDHVDLGGQYEVPGSSSLFTGIIHEVSLFDQFLYPKTFKNMYDAGLAKFGKPIPQGLLATPLTDFPLMVEGRTIDTSFDIGGPAIENEFYIIKLEIVNVPTHGQLFVAGNLTSELVNGTLLDTAFDGYATLHYKSFEDHYFNKPDTTSSGSPILDIEPESFVYRMVAIDRETGETLGYSAPAEQVIEVRNLNDTPNLTAPVNAILDSKPSVLERVFYVDGIELDDIDKDVDKVRVSLWARNGGSLSLNSEHATLADFASCSQRSAYRNETMDWRCIGGSTNARNMTFVAEPSGVNLILSHLAYRPRSKEADDEIIIAIFDGAGGECLSTIEHQMNVATIQSVREGCFKAEARIQVPSTASVEAEEEANEFRLFGIGREHLIWAAAASLLFFCCVGCCCGRDLLKWLCGCAGNREEAGDRPIETRPAKKNPKGDDDDAKFVDLEIGIPTRPPLFLKLEENQLFEQGVDGWNALGNSFEISIGPGSGEVLNINKYDSTLFLAVHDQVLWVQNENSYWTSSDFTIRYEEEEGKWKTLSCNN